MREKITKYFGSVYAMTLLDSMPNLKKKFSYVKFPKSHTQIKRYKKETRKQSPGTFWVMSMQWH